jgi:hypothetical protein
MFDFGGELSQQLLCMAVASGLLPANVTCENYGLPVQMAQSMLTWEPVMLALGISLGVPVAAWVILKLLNIFSNLGARV